jgi:hypothetical protein
MGIVSSTDTRDARGQRDSAADADDPLPSVDEQLGLGGANAGGDRAWHLRLTPLIGVVLAASLILAGAVIALVVAPGPGAVPDASTGPAPSARVEPAPEASGSRPVSAAGTTTLDASDQGFALDYPRGWTRVDGTGDAATVLRISGRNAFSIRTFALREPVAQPQLADMRAVTDAVLSTPGAKLTVLDVRATEVAGLPAVYYLYYFPSGRRQGLHAHYFVFDGARMHSLVFQVVPARQFSHYAADFDAVIASFRTTS